jgi:hypothetical protein
MPAEAASRSISRDGLLSVRKIPSAAFSRAIGFLAFSGRSQPRPSIASAGSASLRAGRKREANSAADSVKFATVGIGTIAHGLSNSLEEAPAITRIERRGRSL